MAAPTVRGRTAPVTGLSTTSPAGTQVGDMVIVFTWETRANVTPPTHTLQANFVEIIQNGDYTETGQSGRLSVAYKIATSAGANSYQAYASSDGMTFWVCWGACSLFAVMDMAVLKKSDPVWIAAMFIMLGLRKWER